MFMFGLGWVVCECFFFFWRGDGGIVNLESNARYCPVSFPGVNVRSGFLEWNLKVKDLATGIP